MKTLVERACVAGPVGLLVLVLTFSIGVAAEPGLQEQAEDAWRSFRVSEAVELYENLLGEDPGVAAFRSAAEFYLAMRFVDRANGAVTTGLERFPGDPALLEKIAVVAALRGDHRRAADLIRESWRHGAGVVDWVDDPTLVLYVTEADYRDLLRPVEIAEGVIGAPVDVQRNRLKVLAGAMTVEAAPVVVTAILETEDPETLRLGMRAILSLGARSVGPLGIIMERCDARQRRAALLEIYRQGDPAYLALLQAAADSDAYGPNADLAAVTAALIRARALAPAEARAELATVDANNGYHYLVLGALADLEGRLGNPGEAARLGAQAKAGRPSFPVPGKTASDLSEYWECKERADLLFIAELTYHNDYVEPIDARVYGLPEHDFDDSRALSIAERQFLRQWFREQGEPLAELGQLQYPREVRHLLNELQWAAGTLVDCSGLLDEGDPGRMAEDGGEIKLEEDTYDDNEVNIVVNPWDQRYLVATSNPAPYPGDNKLFRSSDWGKTWTQGVISGTGCDPVSYYAQYDSGSGMEEVVYHSYLWGPNVKYSTNNGQTWSSCATVGSGGDRQDLAVDTTPTSACFNTLYVAWQNSNQYMRASSGTTFPFCQSWKSTDSTGVGSTIGSAIVVSTNGIAQNIFTQHGSPGGVYTARTDNCGTSWQNEVKLFNINNAGDFEWGIPSTCTRQIYYYPQADSDRQLSSALRNNIYVVWNDLSSSCTPPGCSGYTSTCNNDVFFGVGEPDDPDDPSSWSWSSYNLSALYSDNKTDEFYPSLTVDQADGAVYVSYYRTGSGSVSADARQKQVHYVLLKSIDGGTTWEGPLQITDEPTDESGSGANLGMQWGDYTWNDVINGVIYPSWTDRRESQDEDIWSSKVCSEPTHWSERAPTFTPEPTTATAIGSKNIEVSWTLPDVYWGDGGEDPAARYFELWVDGSLEQGNLDPATISAIYTATDCTASHDFVVKAVNQCGLAKTYATGTATATGCCESNPTVDVTPDGPIDSCTGIGVLLTANLSGGTGPFDYQWYRDDIVITGATGNQYLANDSGTHSYNCGVTATGCTESASDPYPVVLSWRSDPIFAGIESVSDPGFADCTLELAWSPATAACAGGITYSVYRSTTSGFDPDVANRLAEGVVNTSYSDVNGLNDGQTYHYIVRARHTSNSVEDDNTVEESGTPSGPATIGTWTDDAGDTGSAQLATETTWTVNATEGNIGPKVYKTGTYPHDSCFAITTPILHLGTDAQLTFYSKYDIEDDWDKGEVQISSNGGAWTRVEVNYPGYASNTGYDACGLPAGFFFTGSDPIYGLYSASLSAWSDQDVQLRWVLSSDPLVNGTGWWVDDIEITNVEVAGACTPFVGQPEIFADGFEDGDTSAWSSSVP